MGSRPFLIHHDVIEGMEEEFVCLLERIRGGISTTLSVYIYILTPISSATKWEQEKWSLYCKKYIERNDTSK